MLSFFDDREDSKIKENTRNSLLRLLPLLKSNFYLNSSRKKVRLLKYFARVYHFSDEIKLFHYSGVLGSTKNISDGLDMELTASGFSLENDEIALLKFIGEACERFSQRVYRVNDLQTSTYNNITNECY